MVVGDPNDQGHKEDSTPECYEYFRGQNFRTPPKLNHKGSDDKEASIYWRLDKKLKEPREEEKNTQRDRPLIRSKGLST